MNNQTLLQVLRTKAKQEQKLTLEVMELIRQVEERRLFLELGFSSLFEFVTQDLGFEPSSAMRRIQAARLIREIPEIKQKINDKKLSLSVVSQAQTFFRKSAKATGKKLPIASKVEVLKKLEQKSVRDAEKELVKINPEVAKTSERRKEITESLTELKLTLNTDTIKKLDELRVAFAHQNPDLSDTGLIHLLIEKAHSQLLKDRNRPREAKLKKAKDEIQTQHFAPQQPASVVTTHPQANRPRRSTPTAKVKRQVWQRDQGKCQFVSLKTGKKCEAQAFLELDHIVRVRHGGNNSAENLRLLCRAHNQWRG